MTVTLEREQAAAPPSPVAELTESAEPTTHVMHVHDFHGPTTTMTWTVGEPCEAEAADVFASRLESGYFAFATRAPGQHEQLRTFDPEAPTIVVTRPLQGG